MRTKTVLALYCSAFFLSGCVTPIQDLSQGNVGQISYPSSVEKIDLLGELVLPDHPTTGKIPAMILVHGSGGRAGNLDRERRWGNLLRQYGIATLAIDYFTPRNVDFNSSTQPAPAHDIYDAVKILATHSRIDPQRIGVLGFSRGGYLAATTSNNGGRFTNGIKTAVHVALYPSCEYLMDLKTEPSYPPLLILIGSKDSYSSAQSCVDLAKNKSAAGRGIKAVVYQGAYHGWDGSFNGTFYHRAMNTHAEIRSDHNFTKKSMDDVIDFISLPMMLNNNSNNK